MSSPRRGARPPSAAGEVTLVSLDEAGLQPRSSRLLHAKLDLRHVQGGQRASFSGAHASKDPSVENNIDMVS